MNTDSSGSYYDPTVNGSVPISPTGSLTPATASMNSDLSTSDPTLQTYGSTYDTSQTYGTTNSQSNPNTFDTNLCYSGGSDELGIVDGSDAYALYEMEALTLDTNNQPLLPPSFAEWYNAHGPESKSSSEVGVAWENEGSGSDGSQTNFGQGKSAYNTGPSDSTMPSSKPQEVAGILGTGNASVTTKSVSDIIIYQPGDSAPIRIPNSVNGTAWNADASSTSSQGVDQSATTQTAVGISAMGGDKGVDSTQFLLPQTNYRTDSVTEFRAFVSENVEYRESYDRTTGVYTRVLDVHTDSGDLHHEEVYNENNRNSKMYLEINSGEGHAITTSERLRGMRVTEGEVIVGDTETPQDRDTSFRWTVDALASGLQSGTSLKPSGATSDLHEREAAPTQAPGRDLSITDPKQAVAKSESKSTSLISPSMDPKAYQQQVESEMNVDSRASPGPAQAGRGMASTQQDAKPMAKMPEVNSQPYFQAPAFPNRPIMMQKSADPKASIPKPIVSPNAAPQNKGEGLQSLAVGGIGAAANSPKGYTLKVPDSYDGVKMRAYQQRVLQGGIGRNAGRENPTSLRRNTSEQRAAKNEFLTRKDNFPVKETSQSGKGWDIDHRIELQHDLFETSGNNWKDYDFRDRVLNRAEGRTSYKLNSGPQGKPAGGVARVSEAGRWYHTPHFRGLVRLGGNGFAAYGAYQTIDKVWTAYKAEGTIGDQTAKVAASELSGWGGAFYMGELLAPWGVWCGPYSWACVPALGLVGGGLGYFLGTSAVDQLLDSSNFILEH